MVLGWQERAGSGGGGGESQFVDLYSLRLSISKFKNLNHIRLAPCKVIRNPQSR